MIKVKHSKRKKINRILLVLTLLGFLFFHFYAPRFITEIKNPFIEVLRNKNNIIKSHTSFDNNELDGRYLNFKSFDDVELVSYLTYSNLAVVKGTIILLHGIRSNKESYAKLAKKLANLGYNTIALDSRAHGESDGFHCTFGVKEKNDISELISVLKTQENITNNIGVWGKSLGGAIALQAIGNDERIKFGIVESTFSDFKTIVHDYFKYHTGFNIKPVTNYLIYRAGKIAEFNIEDAKPIKYCKNIKQPILVVHGKEDERVSIKYAIDNYKAIPSTQKEFIQVEKAKHLNVWAIGGDDYFKKVMTFITKNTNDK